MHNRIRAPYRVHTVQYGCKDQCDCPACSGLVCLDRPRYFAGQLLTERELNSQLAYTIAKNKLHNRYLWGYGIVCGLEVTCHGCDSGMVTVHPGYALDACGNDVVVCEAHDFDVIEAINACRRQEPCDCDPWRESRRLDCRDAEQEWCITIRYRETEGRPTTALVSQTNGQCGCGHGNGCGCGQNGGQNGKRAAQPVQQATKVGRCEPTRTLEGYELGVLCLPDEDDAEQDGIGALLEQLKKLGLHLPVECVLQCIADFQRFSIQAQQIRDLLDSFTARNQVYQLLCRLLDDVRNYLLDSRLTYCDLTRQLGLIVCPQPPLSTAGWPEYQSLVQQALNAVAQILINALQNCLCLEALPKCPADPCEDRLILACVTVQDGRVVSICHSKRRYVLTVQNLISALISVVFSNWCCEPFNFERDPASLRGSVFEPAFGVRMSSRPMAAAANLMRMFAAEPAFATAPLEETWDPAVLTGQPVETVREMLGDQVVAEETVDWSAPETLLRNMETPVLRKDEPLKLYVDARGQVVGIGRYAASQHLRLELARANERISALEAQVTALLDRL